MFMHEERSLDEIKEYHFVYKLDRLIEDSRLEESDLFLEAEYSVNQRLKLFEDIAPSSFQAHNDENELYYSEPVTKPHT
jgi:hypothetical protein